MFVKLIVVGEFRSALQVAHESQLDIGFAFLCGVKMAEQSTSLGLGMEKCHAGAPGSYICDSRVGHESSVVVEGKEERNYFNNNLRSNILYYISQNF